jgi:micrococcal nuclease
MKGTIIAPRGTVLSGIATVCRDGDEFILGSEIGRVHIRLIWMDAPELNQPYGGEAKRELWKLVEGLSLHAYIKGHDKYGRSLALVMRDDGLVVNLEMIRIGAAHYYPRFGHGWRSMLRAEATAKAEKRGLWALAHAEVPEDWRRRFRYRVRYRLR